MQIPSGRPDAVACVTGGRGAPRLHGTVKFFTMGKQVLVVAQICGLPTTETGIFAMHIHEVPAAQARIFPIQAAILIPVRSFIPGMPGTYRRSFPAAEKPFLRY